MHSVADKYFVTDKSFASDAATAFSAARLILWLLPHSSKRGSFSSRASSCDRHSRAIQLDDNLTLAQWVERSLNPGSQYAPLTVSLDDTSSACLSRKGSAKEEETYNQKTNLSPEATRADLENALNRHRIMYKNGFCNLPRAEQEAMRNEFAAYLQELCQDDEERASELTEANRRLLRDLGGVPAVVDLFLPTPLGASGGGLALSRRHRRRSTGNESSPNLNGAENADARLTKRRYDRMDRILDSNILALEVFATLALLCWIDYELKERSQRYVNWCPSWMNNLRQKAYSTVYSMTSRTEDSSPDMTNDTQSV